VDARGAQGFVTAGSGANVTNLIRPDGHISGLGLNSGQMLLVRDIDGSSIPITVDQNFTMGTGGLLKLAMEADDWGSTISFAPGITVARGGTLELTFAEGVSLTSQIGRTFDLFDWAGVSPTGTFTVDGSYVWDLTNLYTSGEVTFLAAAGLPGDFNNDNSVDAADYIWYRKGLGSGVYSQAAYNVWRTHFGLTTTGGSGLDSQPSVPEPAGLASPAVGFFGTAACICSRRRRCRNV
jgi:hypothetical protein